MKPSGIQLEIKNLSRTARYLVGDSGGRDSVVLLHALIQAGFKRLVICHLNHGLRRRRCAVCRRFGKAVGTGMRVGEGGCRAVGCKRV